MKCQTEKIAVDPAPHAAAPLLRITHGIADTVMTIANVSVAAAVVLGGKIGDVKTTEVQAVGGKHGEMTEAIAMRIGGGMTETLIAEELIMMLERGGEIRGRQQGTKI
jgi:hypothetical protein